MHLQPGAADRELDDEVLDAQQRLVRRRGGGRCRCRPSDGLPAVDGVGGRRPRGLPVARPAPRRPRACRPGTSRRNAWPGVVGVDRAAAPRRGTGPARTGSAARTGSPCGGLTRSGGRPPIASSRVWLGVVELRDRLAAAPRCRASHVARTARAVGACSTIWPAYITAMSSVRPATTPRSWVTRIIAMKRSRCCSLRAGRGSAPAR